MVTYLGNPRTCWCYLLHFLKNPSFCSRPKYLKSAEAIFVLFCILAQSVYSTIKPCSSAKQSVWRVILHVEAYSYKYESRAGFLAPAGEIRLSYQQCTGFLAQLCCQFFWTTMLEGAHCQREGDAELTRVWWSIFILGVGGSQRYSFFELISRFTWSLCHEDLQLIS